MIFEVAMQNTGSTFKFDSKNLTKTCTTVAEFIEAYELNNVSTPIAIIGTTIEGKQIAVNKTQISDIMSYGEGVGLSDDKFRREPPRLATEPLTQPR